MMERQKLSSTSTAGIAAYLAMAIGLACLVYAGKTSMGESPPPLPFVLAIALVGFANCTTGWLMLGRNRIAWAFALSINGTCSVIALFGTPNVKEAFDVNGWVALQPCVAFLITTVLLSMNSDEF